jgi:alcohol dehydrogenase class IV
MVDHLSRSALRILSGTGSIERLAAELERVGATRPLLLYGKSIAMERELLDRTRRALGPRQVACFDGVRANSPVGAVQEAAAALMRHGADAIVAIGGGSAFVSARATAVIASEGSDVEALATHRDANGKIMSPRLRKPKVPILAVPTSPTTAVGKAGTALTVPGRASRLALYDPKTRPASIVLDPAFLATAPGELVRNASLTAYAMAAEGALTKRSNLIADADLAQAAALLTEHLPEVGGRGDDAEARMSLALAGILSGSGTETSGGGLCAAISHVLGHYLHVHNGIVDAIVLPYVIEHVERQVPVHQVRRLSAVLGSGPTGAPSSRLRTFLASLPIPRRLRDVGLSAALIPDLARDVLTDPATDNWICSATPQVVRDILGVAW